jgi:hypothetical protein
MRDAPRFFGFFGKMHLTVPPFNNFSGQQWQRDSNQNLVEDGIGYGYFL